MTTPRCSTPRFITPADAPGWPHTPSTELFRQAQAGNHPDLAKLFHEFSNVHKFREQAREEYEGLRLTNPAKPPRGHIIAVALTGNAESTIGIGVSKDSTAIFSLLLRDPDWTGMDPILPVFAGKHAIILGHPATGRPSAAIGLHDHLLPDDMPGYQPPQQHPETIALTNVLRYHGATVHWLNF